MEALPLTVICVFSLLYQGTVGLAVTLAVADHGGGWERDHPPYGRRLAAMALPALMGTALLLPLVAMADLSVPRVIPRWVLLSLAALLPFAAVTLGWGIVWVRGGPALVRRRWGSGALQAGVLGMAVTAGLLLFLCEQTLWRSGVVLAAMAGSAGVLGSLGALTCAAAPAARESAEIAATIPRLILRGALVLSLMAFVEVAAGWLVMGRSPVAGRYLLWWLVGGLVMPTVALNLALPRWPALPWLWPAVLTLAIAGQWAAHHLMFIFGEMVPPPGAL